MEKERLDVLLVNRGMVESREKAKAIIMTGNVFVNEQREDKAGQKFPVDVYIEIRGKKLKFVSRGGYKLEKALQVFPIDLTDLTCMDVGCKMERNLSIRSMSVRISLPGNCGRMSVSAPWKKRISAM